MTCSKLNPRCMIVTFLSWMIFTTGIIFYCFNSVIQVSMKVNEVTLKVNEVTSVRLTPDNTPYDCHLHSTDRNRLFYNRIPKCGSSTLIELLGKLAARNNFVHLNSKVYFGHKVNEEEQRTIVKDMKSFPSPCSYDRHVFFIDFTKFGESPPLFMNVVRDPVERTISSYFFRRMRSNETKIKPRSSWLKRKFEDCVRMQDPECTYLDGHTYTGIQVPYFCGHEQHCQILNNPDALQQAKQNIEKHYSVVGTLEQMNMTIQVLETILPHFFAGAFEVLHNSGIHSNRNSYKEQVKEEVRDILRTNLTSEYELYHFVKQRLYYQYTTLVEVPPQIHLYENTL